MDSKEVEIKAVRTLLDSAEVIEIPKRKLFGGFSKKSRKFNVYYITGNTLLRISELSINMVFDEEELTTNTLGASKVFVAKNATDIYKVLAFAILNRNWMIKLFGTLLAKYIQDRLSSNDTLRITLKILEMSDYGSFINTIRLMKGVNMAKPKKTNLSPMESGG